MLNAQSLAALENNGWTSHFRRPLYDGYAFSCIPDTVEKLLTGQGEQPLPPEAVGGKFETFNCTILFLIDGFGWEFFEGFSSGFPFLTRFLKEGTASKISSEFPSTTAAHVTSLHTGKQVAETGIYEWFYYEPLVDRMIAPLLFSYAGDHVNGTLKRDGYLPEVIFPFETVYQKLNRKGVRSIVMQQEEIAHSPYSNALIAGAEVIPYGHFPEALDALVAMCSQPFSQPTYIFVYHGNIDAEGHRHGITSPQFSDAVTQCWTALESHFWQKLSGCPNKTAVICTADHGMTPVDPKTTVLLNRICPELETMICKNRNGIPLVPAGSCRDFFLHVEDPEEAKQVLDRQLKGKADVVFVKELLEGGFFGSRPVSKRLQERVGNLVVLPYLGESVFWKFEKHRLEQHFYAAHGGLTPNEMESIFLFAPLGR